MRGCLLELIHQLHELRIIERQLLIKQLHKLLHTTAQPTSSRPTPADTSQLTNPSPLLSKCPNNRLFFPLSQPDSF